MRRESKHAVVRRLQFAAAELEVIGDIVHREGDTVLREQLRSLTERIRDCIGSVSDGNKSGLRPVLFLKQDLDSTHKRVEN